MPLLPLFTGETKTPITLSYGAYYKTASSFVDLSPTFGLLYKYVTIPISPNHGLFYQISYFRTEYGLYVKVQQELAFGVNYNLDTDPLNNKFGVFYKSFSSGTSQTNNFGLFYLKGYSAQSVVFNPVIVLFLSNFHIFSLMQKYLYEKTPVRLAINKKAQNATSIITKIGQYFVSNVYYSTGKSTDILELQSTQLAGKLTNPETITVTLKSPIPFEYGIYNSDLSESQTFTCVQFAETDQASKLEILDNAGNLVSHKTINVLNSREKTNDLVLSYSNFDLDSHNGIIFARLQDEYNGTISLTINGRNYKLSKNFIQLLEMTSNTKQNFTISVTPYGESLQYSLLNLEFFIGVPALFNVSNFGATTLNQIVTSGAVGDAKLSLGIIRQIATTFVSLLVGTIYDDKQI